MGSKVDKRYFFIYDKSLSRRSLMMLLSLFIEAAVVGVVCIVFLILFVVAGIRQIIKNKDL